MGAPTVPLDVVNLALLQLKQKPLTSLESTDETAAVVANLFYDQIRQELLAMRQWNCARTRAEISLATDTEPVFDYGGYYDLPADCLRLHHVGTEYDQWGSVVKWTHDIEGKRLLYAQGGEDPPDSLQIEYTSDLTDVTKMGPSFIKALYTRLAAAMAIPITGDDDIAMREEKRAEKALREASTIDHRQRPARIIERDPIAQARGNDSTDIWDGDLRVPADSWPS